MTRYPECAATDEGPGANYPSPTMGNFMLSQLRESSGNPFRACVRASAGFHSRMARKYGVDNPQGMAHYKLAEAFGNPTTRLQEFILKGGEFGNIPPKAVCKAHKDSIKYHKKEAEKVGLHTPMGHAHISAMAHHVDELNQAKQKMQASQFGYTGRRSPVPGIPKKSQQPSQDIRQQKPLIKLKPRSAECNIGKEAGVKGMKWYQHHLTATAAGFQHLRTVPARSKFGLVSGGARIYSKPGERGKLFVYSDGSWKHSGIGGPPAIGDDHASLRKHLGRSGSEHEASGDQYVAQRYDDSHPEGFKAPISGDIKPSGIDRESFESRKRKFEARAYGRTAFGPVHGGGPGSGPKSSQKPAQKPDPPRLSQAAWVQKIRQKPVDESEVAPPGWEGTVKSMKKHKDITNPWALAWSMKKAGAKPHKKESGEKAGWKRGSVLVRPQHLVAASQPRNKFIMKEF